MRSANCVNCGSEVWLGAFFEGHFLCDDCHAKAADIIAQLRAELDEARKIIHATKDSLAVRLAVSPETWASFDEDELKACDAWLSAHPEETK